ncbi:hypothetical protein RAA17_09655 [Komagataeibacter rhaeticus]|nr:hypothetical protein [Komagataeibacter rhaeticus]
MLGYIVFPLLAMMAMRVASMRSALALCVASLVTLVAILFACHHANNNPTGTFGAIRMFFCFAAGIMLYRAYHLAPEAYRPVRGGHYGRGGGVYCRYTVLSGAAGL